MTTFDACSIIESFDGEQHSQEEIVEAFQALIDSGDAWRLQGWYGRSAASLIAQGLCVPATRDRDATHFAPEAF